MSTFELGDKVLVYQGELLYEAKILKIFYPLSKIIKSNDEKSKEVIETEPDAKFLDKFRAAKAYFVHYKGWKPKWDEWVLSDRMLVYNNENLIKQKELVQSQKTAGTTVQETRPKVKLTIKSTQKQSRNGSAAVSDSSKKTELKIQIPGTIKYVLVDDWENVTKKRQLVKLPSKNNVSKILTAYLTQLQLNVTNGDDPELDNKLETVRSLPIFFNNALGSLLLYRHERTQYKSILDRFPDAEMCQVYGLNHLLRLCSILPNLVIQANMDSQSILLIRSFLEDFYQFLSDNLKELTEEYENDLPTY
ncbi:hypothetical protein OGAPHI_004320 [Ogataea philodendri]|uniref:Chromatin modification-related protein EAF3 n=1 Tax=Ogataea philodendri TaxID=1378263 RepID=A0A9P8P6V1_9ASCO|nr:uncharacterized protein OGAPHI_004320 [Ogataea philodendri]KAH3666131.1 hypothetical protein OGAPHI_004320 [Ogataea philodendri]